MDRELLIAVSGIIIFGATEEEGERGWSDRVRREDAISELRAEARPKSPKISFGVFGDVRHR